MPGKTVMTMRGASRLHNPSLAHIFRNARFIEKRGSGVYSEIANAGLSAPDNVEIIDRVHVAIHVVDQSVTPKPVSQHCYARSKDGRHVGRDGVGMSHPGNEVDEEPTFALTA